VKDLGLTAQLATLHKERVGFKRLLVGKINEE
jgi:hypothetical protein